MFGFLFFDVELPALLAGPALAAEGYHTQKKDGKLALADDSGFLLTDYIYEQSHGYRRWQHTHIYVSSGLSLWGPPFRIGTNSELAIITIKSAAKP